MKEFELAQFIRSTVPERLWHASWSLNQYFESKGYVILYNGDPAPIGKTSFRARQVALAVRGMLAES